MALVVKARFGGDLGDGGPGIANDSAVVHLRSRSKKLRLYGGDVMVSGKGDTPNGEIDPS